MTAEIRNIKEEDNNFRRIVDFAMEAKRDLAGAASAVELEIRSDQNRIKYRIELS